MVRCCRSWLPYLHQRGVRKRHQLGLGIGPIGRSGLMPFLWVRIPRRVPIHIVKEHWRRWEVKDDKTHKENERWWEIQSSSMHRENHRPYLPPEGNSWGARRVRCDFSKPQNSCVPPTRQKIRMFNHQRSAKMTEAWVFKTHCARLLS